MARKAEHDIYEEPRTNYVGIRIGDTLKENLEAIAFVRYSTLSRVIRMFLEKYVAEHEDEMQLYYKMYNEHKEALTGERWP